MGGLCFGRGFSGVKAGQGCNGNSGAMCKRRVIREGAKLLIGSRSVQGQTIHAHEKKIRVLPLVRSTKTARSSP